MSEQKLAPEDKLWGELYALMCKFPAVRNGLASMPDKDKFALDDKAAEIIAASGAFKVGAR